MVKCKICIGETGRSKDFENLHFHLLKKHGMTCKEYKQRYPDAPITSAKFRNNQKELMTERHKQIPDLIEKLQAWRHEETGSHYPDTFENPSIDDLEALKEREQWCRMMLGSGIRGQRYKDTYRDLMDCRRALEALLEKLMRES